MTDKEKLEAIKTELIRIKKVRGICPDIMNDILAFIDSLPSEEEPALTGEEQKISNSYCRKIRDKRVLPTLKGTLKHKFLNEFNMLYQTLDMQLCDKCMKEPLKDMCLNFAVWGHCNLQYFGEVSKEEKTKMDSTQEGPTTEIDFEQELYKAFGQVKDFTLGMRIAKWFYDMGKNRQEPVSEDLGEYINELSKQFPEVSFAKLSRIAVRVAKWQKQQDQSTIELAEDHAMFAGMEKMKEQMMAKAINAQCFGFQGTALFSFRLPADNYLVGSEVKVIVIKED